MGGDDAPSTATAGRSASTEKDRYLAEQAVIGRMGGADWVPETVAELDDYVERMRPLHGDERADPRVHRLPRRRQSATTASARRERFDRWVGIRASMSLMPEWARRMTGTYAARAARAALAAPADRLKARLVRWAYPELPCKRMALERANGESRGD